MRALLIVIFLPLLLASCGKPKLFKVDELRTGVKYKGTKGTIFNEKYPFLLFLMFEVDSTTRWTPTSNDIYIAQKILREGFKKMEYGVPKDYGPKVPNHVRGYFFQYVGYRNKSGQRIIQINASWRRRSLVSRLLGIDKDRTTYNSDYTIVMDGGSYYWSAEINLDESKLLMFATHGVG